MYGELNQFQNRKKKNIFFSNIIEIISLIIYEVRFVATVSKYLFSSNNNESKIKIFIVYNKNNDNYQNYHHLINFNDITS